MYNMQIIQEIKQYITEEVSNIIHDLFMNFLMNAPWIALMKVIEIYTLFWMTLKEMNDIYLT